MSTTPEYDDDSTVLRMPQGRGRAGALVPDHALEAGARIGGLEIAGLIGVGGFGIVYLAYDPNLQRQVALKEYMPAALALRVGDTATVVPRSERSRDAFDVGLRSFVNEARLLARFDHPALVKVYRFWEAHGTAYMVMPYYEGPTLKQTLYKLGHPPDEATVRAWLEPLLDALSVMHAEQCFHRDIAPDNILLTPAGPLLLDFGAARRVVGDMTHALTAVLKPGYAPIEQYGDMPGMSQGAWTDLYSLACVLYYAVTGRKPMPSVERLVADGLEPASQLAAGRYSPGLLQAIDAALALRPQDRPQDVATFRVLLAGKAAPPELDPEPVLDPVSAPLSPPVFSPRRAAARSRGPVVLVLVAACVVLAAGTWGAWTWLAPGAIHAPELAQPAPASAPDALPAAAAPAVADQDPRPDPASAVPVLAPEPPAEGGRAATTVAEPAAKPAEPPAPRADPASSVLEPPAVVAEPPAVVAEPPAAVAEPPAVVAEPPAVVAEPPAVVAEPPAVVVEPPAVVAEPPAVVVEPPAVVVADPPAVTATLPPRASTAAPTPAPASRPVAIREPRPPARAPAPPAARAPSPPAAAAAAAPVIAARPPSGHASQAERAVSPARCTEILQKGSLEPLDADEADYLKKEC